MEIKIRNDLGIKQRLLNREEVLELEPNLSPVFDAGVIYDYAYHARDPKEITKKLFELYLKSGGKFKKEEVLSVEQTRYNQTQVKTNSEIFYYEKIVLACGDFSKK